MESKDKEKTIFESVEVSPEVSIQVLTAFLETEVKLNEGLQEQITLLTTQREGYREELESQVKVNKELGKRIEELKHVNLLHKTNLEKQDKQILELEGMVKELTGIKEGYDRELDLAHTTMHYWQNLNKQSDKRILELEELVKEAWDASGDNRSHCGSRECETCDRLFPNHLNKEEWLKSKGVPTA